MKYEPPDESVRFGRNLFGWGDKMHVENRVTRARMLAQEWLEGVGVEINMSNEDIVSTQILLAELINALQGLNYKGEEVEA